MPRSKAGHRTVLIYAAINAFSLAKRGPSTQDKGDGEQVQQNSEQKNLQLTAKTSPRQNMHTRYGHLANMLAIIFSHLVSL